MIRFICGALALAACSLSVFAGTPRQDDAASAPMRFTRFDEGPVAGRNLIGTKVHLVPSCRHDDADFMDGIARMMRASRPAL